MLTKVFWAVLGLDVLAAMVLWHFARSTPGAAVLLFLVVLIAIALFAALFTLVRAEWMRVIAFVLMAIPSGLLIGFAGVSAFTLMRDERRFNGTAYFHGAGLELAQALVRTDTEAVKALIPRAGDLNAPQGSGVSLWQFGVQQARNTDDSVAMLRALVAGGADPRRDRSPDSLVHAMSQGARLTQALLEMGEDPNVLDGEKRPVWWWALDMNGDEKDNEILPVLLEHGADLRLRAPDGRGPVAKAIGTNRWHLACLLIARGAEWREEKIKGRSVAEELERELLRREEYELPVSESLTEALSAMTGRTVVAQKAEEPRVPEVLRMASLDKLGEVRGEVEKLARRPDWAKRVDAFFDDGGGTQRDEAALVLSLHPQGVPEEVLEHCWQVVRGQIAWFDGFGKGSSKEPKAWLLKKTAVIVSGLGSVAGPVKERHRGDFEALRERVEKCRQANDPEAGRLAELAPKSW